MVIHSHNSGFLIIPVDSNYQKNLKPQLKGLSVPTIDLWQISAFYGQIIVICYHIPNKLQ